MTGMPPNPYLETYLRDHRAGAAAGVRLAERLRDEGGDAALRDEMVGIARDISADRDQLEQLMVALDVRPSLVKSALADAGQHLGRLKLNGRLRGRSPLSDVLELEALSAGIAAKRDLWRALATLAPDVGAVDGSEVARLETRATEQLERVLALHRTAARHALVGVPDPVG